MKKKVFELLTLAAASPARSPHGRQKVLIPEYDLTRRFDSYTFTNKAWKKSLSFQAWLVHVKYQCFPSKQEVAINPFCMVYSAPNFIYWVTEHIFVSVFCHSHSSPLWQEEITLLMILYCEHQSFPIYIFFPKRRVVEPQVKEWGEGRSGEGQSEPFLAVCVLLTD